MPWDDGGGDGKCSHSQNQSALEGLFNRRRNKLGQMVPGGSRLPGSIAFLLTTVLASIVAYYALTFRVDADELSVVMRLGKVTRLEPPGLHFRMPHPIDDVRLPKVTQQNIVEIGMRASTGAGASYVREESLILAGDENIVDVNFVVFWRIRDAQQYCSTFRTQRSALRKWPRAPCARSLANPTANRSDRGAPDDGASRR